jgi:hypothetical protein
MIVRLKLDKIKNNIGKDIVYSSVQAFSRLKDDFTLVTFDLFQVVDSLIERLEGDDASLFEFGQDAEHDSMLCLLHHKEDCEKSFVGAPLLEASFHCPPRLSELVEDNVPDFSSGLCNATLYKNIFAADFFMKQWLVLAQRKGKVD